MKKNYVFLIMILCHFAMTDVWSADAITYFSCVVKEPVSNNEVEKVTIKFAIENLNVFENEGRLLQYPGSDEEDGAILVMPKILDGDRNSLMSNLNSQGGDLRIEGDHIRLFGDGDGYQFTDLVVWDVGSSESDILEGYVRDYGPTYGDDETFKQFIKCRRSTKKL